MEAKYPINIKTSFQEILILMTTYIFTRLIEKKWRISLNPIEQY